MTTVLPRPDEKVSSPPPARLRQVAGASPRSEPAQPPLRTPGFDRRQVERSLITGLGALFVLLALILGFAFFVSGGRTEALQREGFDEFTIGSLLIGDGTVGAGEEWPDELPVALLRIPRYDRSMAVFGGIGKAQLRRGPGYDPTTARPGFFGNTVVIGKSSTYGSPFAHLDKLEVGDQLIMTTVGGTVAFEVVEARITDKNDPFIYEGTDDAWLTLVGHSGGPLSSERTVVRAAYAAGVVDGNIVGPRIPDSSREGFAPILAAGLIALIAVAVMSGELIVAKYVPVRAARWMVLPVVAAVSLPLIEQLLLLLPRTW